MDLNMALYEHWLDQLDQHSAKIGFLTVTCRLKLKNLKDKKAVLDTQIGKDHIISCMETK